MARANRRPRPTSSAEHNSSSSSSPSATATPPLVGDDEQQQQRQPDYEKRARDLEIQNRAHQVRRSIDLFPISTVCSQKYVWREMPALYAVSIDVEYFEPVNRLQLIVCLVKLSSTSSFRGSDDFPDSPSSSTVLIMWIYIRC